MKGLKKYMGRKFWNDAWDNKFPCVDDCKDRFPGCHSKCEKYQKALEEHRAKKKLIYDHMDKETAFYGVRLKGKKHYRQERK